MLSFKFKFYKNYFNSKNAKIFSMHENKNYVINLKFNKKLSYDLFYALLKKKLQVLRNYLLKNLALNYIRKFVNFVEASMLFIFKKNNSLRFCVNYRDLNVITIKNKSFLFQIKETLDRLMSATHFTKFDLKNAYHRI